MKVYKLLLLVIYFLINACNNPNEPSTEIDYSRIFYMCYNFETKSYYVEYADLNNLEKIKKVNLNAKIENWVVLANSFMSEKHQKFILATLSKVYFVDTRKGQLVKTLDIPYEGFFDDMMGPPVIVFENLDDKNVLLVLHTSIYLLNLENMSYKKIFDGSLIGLNVEIRHMKITNDNNGVFVLTRTVGLSGLREDLYKIDILTGKHFFVDEIANEDGKESIIGIANNNLICFVKEKLKLLKYDTSTGKKIDEKEVDYKHVFILNLEQIPLTNKLIGFQAINSEDKSFVELDTDKLEIKEIGINEKNYFLKNYQKRNDNLYGILRSPTNYKIYLLPNLKEVYNINQFNPKAIYAFIIGGIK